MFLCKNASDEWLQLQNYVREAKRNRNWHFDTFSQGQGNEYGSPLSPISHKKVEKADYIMRIPPILAIFLLHPRNLEAQHAPGPRLLASTIQVLITIIQNKSIFLQGGWHRSKWIFLLHLQGGRFWKRGYLIIQVSSTSWKAGRLVPAKIPNVVSCARSCIILEQHNPCSCNAITYTRSQRLTCCWYISG